MHPDGRDDSDGLPRSILRATLLAATALVLARTALIALKDEYFASGLLGLGARSAARHVLEGYAMCLIPVLVLAGAVGSMALRGRRTPLWSALFASVVAGYLFVSFRLPPRMYYAPQFDGARAYAAHGGALLAALIATASLVPSVRIPARRALTFAAILLVLLPAAALRLWRSDAGQDPRPNLILISIDTLRADRLGCYGYDAPTSPEIDRFARDAVVFTNAYSPESWTLPAHMSMLTSLYPTSHGVAEERALPRKVPTLASILSREGYQTFAVVDGAYWISPKFGFARGFDSYQIMPDYAEVKIDGMLSLIDDLERGPFFLFAHLYDVHSDKTDLPYEADPEDIQTFAGWYAGDFTGCNERGECASEMLFAMVGRREALSEEDARYVSCLYDAGIRTLDRKLKKLFDGLERRGLFENSVILVTADHGEEFFEHGRPVHTQYFDECVRIPFILRPPGGRAERPASTDQLASLVDVMPTLLSYCGITPRLTQGVSLAPVVDGAELPTPRDRVLIDGRQPLLGLRTTRWSLVPTEGRLAGFDLSNDARQSTDLLAGEVLPMELEDLRLQLEAEAETLRALADQFGPGEEQKASGHDAEDLRALGYGGE